MNLISPLEVAGLRQAVLDNVLDMTCLVERDQAQSESGDDYGHTPNWQPLHEALPCHYWVVNRLETTTANIAVIVSDAQLLAPLVDIREADRIRLITHQGQLLVPNPVSVRGVEPWPYYLKLSLRELA